ncbi:flotillin like protein [Gemmatimonas aurantiaca T-27]|uniref:Flotillin like protein n=1 Tax=Gemmatimonas aurantiaca (strain DSM 14586 / JCM 11422 / NBRC 100505 / T-27) TaxID=379066 RepID=C1A984_GEMAT|nr:flotillin like protein [Gemmatimonas aurantiaca T-27]
MLDGIGGTALFSLGGVVFVIVMIMLLIASLKQLLLIVPPNMVAVITGRKRALSDGTAVGYRVVRGGRTFRIPILEQAQWMTLNTIPLTISVRNAIARGGIPIDVQAVANVKIASMPEEVFNNAVERILGSERQVADLAQETLAANLRGVLSTLTPEEANEDRVKFETELMKEVTRDLQKLGLQLDMLKIQNISDDAGYLRAYGRIRTAEVLRDAQIAEARTKAETEREQARASQEADVARAQSQVIIAAAQNDLRVKQAELDRQAQIAERTARAAADEAQARAEKAVEEARVEVTRVRLQVEQVEPARARAEAARADAEAAAAPVIAQGEAQAKALQAIQQQLLAAGDRGLSLLYLQQLPDMIDRLAEAASDVKIDRLVVLDGGDGKGAANATQQKLGVMMKLLEAASAQYGVNPDDLIQGLSQRLGGGTPSKND